MMRQQKKVILDKWKVFMRQRNGFWDTRYKDQWTKIKKEDRVKGKNKGGRAIKAWKKKRKSYENGKNKQLNTKKIEMAIWIEGKQEWKHELSRCSSDFN